MNSESLSTSEDQLVVFKIGDEEFGVNIRDVRSIVSMNTITPIPNSKKFIKGLINLRGGIVIVIDIGVLLGNPQQEINENTKIMVIQMNSRFIGFIVNSETEVMRLAKEQIRPAPAFIKNKINNDYIKGVGIVDSRLIIRLNVLELISRQDQSNN